MHVPFRPLAVILCLVAFVTAIAFPAHAADTGTISGAVFDQNGMPIADAIVKLSGDGLPGGRTVRTGSNGVYHFEYLDPREYIVEVDLPGVGVAKRIAVVEIGRDTQVDLVVVSNDGGLPVRVNTGGLWTSHYSTLDGRVGVSIADFSIAGAGDYTVSARAPQGKRLDAGGIALTRDLGFLGLVRIIVVPLLILFAGVGPGVLILVKSPKPSAAVPAA